MRESAKKLKATAIKVLGKEKGLKMFKAVQKGLKEGKKRELTNAEVRKGRSSEYWDMSARDQWAEDKALGILDWDGN